MLSPMAFLSSSIPAHNDIKSLTATQSTLSVLLKKQKHWSLNEINDFVGLHFYSPTHPCAGVQPRFLLKEGVYWKLKNSCFKNTSIGWQAEQSGATQSSQVDGGQRAKPSLDGFLIFREKKLFQHHLDHISHFFNAI